MDDRPERDAALLSLNSLSDRLLQACQDEDEMVDALEELEVVTRGEKNDANEAGDYTGVIEKFRRKVDRDPEFFTKFCAHIQNVEALSDILVELTSESLILCKLRGSFLSVLLTQVGGTMWSTNSLYYAW